MQSHLSSQGASPVRSFSTDEQGKASAVDRRASPVRFSENQMQPGGAICEGRLHDQRASPVPGPIPEEPDSAQCEAQILDRMLAESEKTLGKIKMIAQSRRFSVQPSGSEGKGSVSVPVGPYSK